MLDIILDLLLFQRFHYIAHNNFTETGFLIQTLHQTPVKSITVPVDNGLH